MIGIVLNIAVLLQLGDDFSDDLSSSSGELRGSDGSLLLHSENDLEGSNSDIDGLGNVDLSGNSGGFVEEPVSILGGGIVSMGSLD